MFWWLKVGFHHDHHISIVCCWIIVVVDQVIFYLYFMRLFMRTSWCYVVDVHVFILNVIVLF